MFTYDLFEASPIQKIVVILPGGFHPFHPGHLSLYKSAQQMFPNADIYYAATNDKSERPFDFADKQALATIAGVPQGRFVQVKSPFMAKEIVDHYDPNTTAVVFARSEKDANQPPVAGGTKKDGSASYLQPYDGNPQPASKHAYMAYLPTVQFKAGASGITSASEIRSQWPSADDATRNKIAQDLYPKNPKAAAQILSKYLGESLREDAAGVGLVRNSKDPRYVMATMGDQNDVDSKTLGKMMKAYHLTGTKAPKTRQEQVKGNIAEAFADPSGLIAAAQLNKSFIITAELDDGKTKKFRIQAQSPRTAQERFLRHYANAKIVSAVEEGTTEGAELKQAKRKYNQAAKDANADQVGAGKKIDTMKKSLRQKDLAKQGMAEEGYGNHPSQRVDPRTGKRYVPPKSPLGQGVTEAGNPAQQAAIAINMKKHHKKPKSMNEFAPPGRDDGDDGFNDDILKQLAAKWWKGDEDPRVEQTLAAAGWEIGQDEGYDNGGVFVVMSGDINGKSYMSWPAEELEGLGEGREWDEGDTEPANNFAVYINGKKWKVFPAGGNWYADSPQERNRLQQLQAWAAKKSAASGKKWTVHLTGEAPTSESVEEAAKGIAHRVRYSYDDPSGKGIASGHITLHAPDKTAAARYATSDLTKRGKKNVKVHAVTPQRVTESKAMLTEAMLREAFLDSIKQTLGNAVNGHVKNVTSMAQALQVIYQTVSDPKRLVAMTFFLKKRLAQFIDALPAQFAKLKQVMKSMQPTGNGLGDFIKALLLVALARAGQALSMTINDETKDAVIGQIYQGVLQITQWTGSILVSGIGALNNALQTLHIASAIWFELVNDINKNLIQTSAVLTAGYSKTESVSENAEQLNIGDPVIITGKGIEFEGKTGDIDSFGDMKRFVVVNLYNHGKHSFHSSDVSYNEYADHEDDLDEDMYQYDKADPYNSEFAPRAGMGRMTLRGWKQSLIKRAAQLAQELEAAGQDIDRAAIWDNVYKKMQNLNMDPIAQEIELAHQELENIRRRGGVRSRAFNK